jgi:acyl carrier protein
MVDASAAGTLEQRVLGLLLEIAPDIDAEALRPELDFRDQFDFDSMDLFTFAAALHRQFGLDIPERDYRQLASLAKCTAYLRRALPAVDATPEGPPH